MAGALIREFVALKVLNPALLASERKRVRSVEEMVALTRFKHPNLIRSINCGEEEGEVYLAMELCSGGDLAKLVKRFGPLPERAVALIGLQVAAGLQEIHQRHGLVHRDIKPSHIELVEELEKDIGAHKLAARIGDQDSLCRIIDFGQIDFMPGRQGKGSRPRRHRFAGTRWAILEQSDIPRGSGRRFRIIFGGFSQAVSA